MNDIEYEESKEHFESLKEVPSCKICQKTFSSIYVYRNHINCVHGENFSGEYKCEICHGSFVSDHHLIKHRHVLHPLQYPPPESPESKRRESINQAYTENPDLPHECLVCQKPFPTFKSFKLHFGKMHKNNEIQVSFRNVWN